MEDEAERERLMRFLLVLRRAGITHPRALWALEQINRGDFAPAQFSALADEDEDLPIGAGEMMTRPSEVARVLAALEPRAGDVVLEIGAGAGYQTAALALLARRVISLERIGALAEAARERIGRARLMTAHVHWADGAQGWLEFAPYDRIVVNAAAREIPPALRAQLVEGGVLVAPILEDKGQRLLRWRGGACEDLGPCRFQPLLDGVREDFTEDQPDAPSALPDQQ